MPEEISTAKVLKLGRFLGHTWTNVTYAELRERLQPGEILVGVVPMSSIPENGSFHRVLRDQAEVSDLTSTCIKGSVPNPKYYGLNEMGT